MKTKEELVENIAKVIYHSRNKTFDEFDDLYHERISYKTQGEAVLKFVLENLSVLNELIIKDILE